MKKRNILIGATMLASPLITEAQNVVFQGSPQQHKEWQAQQRGQTRINESAKRQYIDHVKSEIREIFSNENAFAVLHELNQFHQKSSFFIRTSFIEDKASIAMFNEIDALFADARRRLIFAVEMAIDLEMLHIRRLQVSPTDKLISINILFKQLRQIISENYQGEDAQRLHEKLDKAVTNARVDAKTVQNARQDR